MNPQFLTLDEVMDIHRNQIERYGASMGGSDQKRVVLPGDEQEELD